MKKRWRLRIAFLGLVCLAAGLFTTGQSAWAAIQNGGFEETPIVWTEESSQALLPLIFDTGLVQIPPQAGAFGAWLCGATNEISTLRQQVVVPVGDPFLVYWRWIDSLAPESNNHEGQILINGNIINKFKLSTSSSTNGWSNQAVDLRNFQGQPVSLEIKGVCNSPDERISNLFVDSFAFQATGRTFYYIPLIFNLRAI